MSTRRRSSEHPRRPSIGCWPIFKPVQITGAKPMAIPAVSRVQAFNPHQRHNGRLGDGDAPAKKAVPKRLPSGDKSARPRILLAELEHDPNKLQDVVFDDPFNSQDAFKRSHDREYRKWSDLLAGDRAVARPKFSQASLRWTSCAGPRIHVPAPTSPHRPRKHHYDILDIEEATQLQFRADIKTLTTFYNAGLGKPRDVVDKIRPVLESYCRNLLPMQFDDDDTLGVICGEGPQWRT